MSAVIVWCKFVGAWLLFAGPLYQATLELREEHIQRDRIEAAGVERSQRVSVWWWLLPPVAYVLERQRTKQYSHALFAALDPKDVADLLRYHNKAAGWFLVGLGGLLLAVAHT